MGGVNENFLHWPQRSWAKVIFSQACIKNSVHGGVSASVHAGIHPPRADTPPDQAPPQTRYPPRTDTPPDQAHTPHRADTPQADTLPKQTPSPSRHPLTLPDQLPPPGKQTAAYGQWAAGTHPTGMHSCFFQFHVVFGEKVQNNRLVPLPLGLVLTPPLSERSWIRYYY